MTLIPKLIFIIVMLVFGLAFHIKNHQLVTLNYYIGEVQLSLSVLVFLAVCIGVFLGILVSIPLLVKLKRLNTKLERNIKHKEKEINSFRIMPTKD